MKSRAVKRVFLILVLCVLATALALPALAAGYSKVYGQTQDKLRVRESGSTSAKVIDQIQKSACVYVVESKASGKATFLHVRYRGYEGNVLTGWVCQSDGTDIYVKILSTTQTQKTFKVENGDLPSKRVGIYTKKQRDEALANGSSGSSSSNTSSTMSTATIKDVQTKLKALGIYAGEITGNAGQKTIAAIKAFQKKYGLTADGVAGGKTKTKIDEVYRAKGGAAASSSSAASGSTIGDVQTKLKALGFYSGEITGNAGEKTVAAIKAFQKKYALTEDGVAGTKTVAKINEVYKAKGGTSGTTSSGSTVSDVQTKLKALGFYSGEITGNAGEKTVAAIKAFQKKYALTEDGVAGTKTVAKINEVYKAKGSPAVSAPQYSNTTSSSSTLKNGSTGAAVRSLQENLTALGYYYGDITGHYGSMTEASVRKFQKDKGLSQTGVANKTTIQAINTATNGGTPTSSSGKGETSVAIYGRVNRNNVLMRTGHSTSSASKTSLELSTPLKITKKYTGNDETWYYASASKDGYRYAGYIRSDMVTLISYSDYAASTGKNNDSEVSGLIKVTSDGIVIREGPGTSYGKAGTANKGDMFYYTDHDDGWYKLRNGYYIMDKFATRVSDSEAASLSSGSSSSGSSYKVGDTGSTVTWIQQTLKTLGFYSGDVTGHYGSKTEAAVRSFQSKKGLNPDGIAGSKTIAALQDEAGGGSSSSTSTVAPVNVGAKIYNLNWFTAKSNGVLSKLGLVARHNATLTDLRTGKSMNIYIQSAGNHLDVEPLAASDTKILCSIYGVGSASQINYLRRPMMITTDTDAQIVCSIYGTPHGQQNITNNNFPGQFCLHFWNSKTHNSNKVDEDHMNAIQEAISIVGSSKVTTISSL